ncbi:MAG TPA: hypothetical protein VLH09_03875 [Bryobacteraceae bacterium]|nr:hypothetical protein [Bryobacteraceae bacterium]
MTGQIRAILWAQRRSFLHHLRGGGRAGAILSGLVLTGWYGGWLLAAAMVAWFVSRDGGGQFLSLMLPRGLLFLTLYWQAAPLLLASQGASLDLKRLLAYPIPAGQLFGIEVLLRISTGAELLLVVVGVGTGLFLNAAVNAETTAAGLAFFVLFNLLLAAGLKYQMDRWMARRRLRELLALALVLVAALPQLLTTLGVPARLRGVLDALWGPWWPWSAAASLALGRPSAAAWLVCLFWVAAAWLYGRGQFRRGLEFESSAEAAGGRPASRFRPRLDSIYRLPSRFLSDPLAAVVEKEIRSFVRSPRFRLLFVMGFTFGVLIFLPLMLRARASGGDVPSYHLPLLAGYALLLLADATCWNIFGTDRQAAQLYFLQPAAVWVTVVGKNLAAGAFVLLEITGVVLVWTLLRLPVNPGRIAEAYLAPVILFLYMMAAGNLTSIYYPRAVSPGKATGAGSPATIRILLLLMLPVLSIPVLLAYAARYVWRSEAVFYLVLAASALAGAVLYRYGLVTASSKAEERKERFLAALSASGGPVQSG